MKVEKLLLIRLMDDSNLFQDLYRVPKVSGLEIQYFEPLLSRLSFNMLIVGKAGTCRRFSNVLSYDSSGPAPYWRKLVVFGVRANSTERTANFLCFSRFTQDVLQCFKNYC